MARQTAVNHPNGSYEWREPTYGSTETWVVWLLWILPIVGTIVTVALVALRFVGVGGLESLNFGSALHP